MDDISKYKKPSRFNIRVYGLVVNDRKEVLLSDEYLFGHYFTKFPGGGLEFGEGTIDGLKREFIEETQQSVTIKDHFYTTDYFQTSAFSEKDQLISIYYLVEADDYGAFETKTKRFDFEPKEGAEQLRWKAISEIVIDDLTYPIDQRVAILLREKAARNRL